MQQWFTVHKAGLAQVLGRQTAARAISELISNAWDEPDVTRVAVRLEPIPGKPQVSIEVEDDAPAGFADLSDSYTLFAPSKKKSSPLQRGRFNLGEKLFLARCLEASICSTKGTMVFRRDGTRANHSEARPLGTILCAVMPMTRDELASTLDELHRLISPHNITTLINGTRLQSTTDATSQFSAHLQTEVSDEEGNLRLTNRDTTVEFWRSEPAYLYELGIPVVETELPFSVNIMQKVPLTLDRENVRPGFLRTLKTLLLDRAVYQLNHSEAKAAWVTEVLPNADDHAVSTVLTQRFGEKRVAYDPSDPEASKRAVSLGYTVVPGGALPGAVWERAKSIEAIPAAGQVTPTNNPQFSPDGKDCTVPESQWTPAQQATVQRLRILGEVLLRKPLSIAILNSAQGFIACYSPTYLALNLRRLGHAWFERAEHGLQVEHLDLLIHELGHDWCGDHLDSAYHEALTLLGARLTFLVAEEPRFRDVLATTLKTR
jgi:hypothetical protein